MVLLPAHGSRPSQIAELLDCHPATVRRWIGRFNGEGLAGLADRPRRVAALNRSVAVAEVHGPIEGLDALAEIGPASLENYQPYHAARADLLARAGRHGEAIAAYDRAIELAANTIERGFLVRQRATL